MLQQKKEGEHRAQVLVVHTHMDFKHTETKSEHGLEPPSVRRRVSRVLIVPLDSQPHHNRANESRKRVNLIYTAVRGPSESNTSPRASCLCCLPFPNMLPPSAPWRGVRRGHQLFARRILQGQHPPREQHESGGPESLLHLDLPVSHHLVLKELKSSPRKQSYMLNTSTG